MVKSKKLIGAKIRRDILRIISQQKQPVSTRDLAKKIGRAWYSVQNHCMKLQLEGKITGYKISNLNVWIKKNG